MSAEPNIDRGLLLWLRAGATERGQWRRAVVGMKGQKQMKEQQELVLSNGFKLEGEIIGALRTRRSKSGSRSIGLLPMSSKNGVSLRSVSGFKGAALQAYSRRQSDDLKTQLCAVVGGIGASTSWTGRNVRVNAKGDLLTVSFKRVMPMSVASPADISEEQALAKLGLSKEQYQAMLELQTEPAAQLAEALAE